jgi:hypothetical protein
MPLDEHGSANPPGTQNRLYIVILSEAKLQRSGQSLRGQAFNLRSFLIPQKEQ